MIYPSLLLQLFSFSFTESPLNIAAATDAQLHYPHCSPVDLAHVWRVYAARQGSADTPGVVLTPIQTLKFGDPRVVARRDVSIIQLGLPWVAVVLCTSGACPPCCPSTFPHFCDAGVAHRPPRRGVACRAPGRVPAEGCDIPDIGTGGLLDFF